MIEIPEEPICYNCGNLFNKYDSINSNVNMVTNYICHNCAYILNCPIPYSCNSCGYPLGIYRLVVCRANYVTTVNLALCPNHNCINYIVDKEKRSIGVDIMNIHSWISKVNEIHKHLQKDDYGWKYVIDNNNKILILSKYVIELLNKVIER